MIPLDKPRRSGPKTGDKKSDPEYAAEYRVTTRTIRKWRKLEYPLDDPAEVSRRLSGQKHSKAVPGFEDTPDPADGIKFAKHRKEQLQCEILAFNLEVARGNHIPKSEVTETVSAIGAALAARLMSRHAELAALLEGMSAGQISKEIQKSDREIMREFSDGAKSASWGK